MKTLTLVLLLLACRLSNAQETGGHWRIGTKFRVDRQFYGLEKSSCNYSGPVCFGNAMGRYDYNRMNLTAGITANYALGKRFSLESGINFSQKTTEVGSYYGWCGDFMMCYVPQPEWNLRNFFELPVGVNYSIFNGPVRMHFQLEGIAGIGLRDRFKQTIVYMFQARSGLGVNLTTGICQLSLTAQYGRVLNSNLVEVNEYIASNTLSLEFKTLIQIK